jgi:hypothetical protein
MKKWQQILNPRVKKTQYHIPNKLLVPFEIVAMWTPYQNKKTISFGHKLYPSFELNSSIFEEDERFFGSLCVTIVIVTAKNKRTMFTFSTSCYPSTSFLSPSKASYIRYLIFLVPPLYIYLKSHTISYVIYWNQERNKRLLYVSKLKLFHCDIYYWIIHCSIVIHIG